MSGFAKVHSSLWDGTLGQRPDVWPLFVFLLCNADARGRVDMTPEAISARSGLSLEVVRLGLVHLESEDAGSRSPVEGGRRIVRLDTHRDWGWRIVNYQRYREIRDPDERRRQTREAMRRHRSKPSLATVSHGEPRLAQAEAEAEAVKKNQHPPTPLNGTAPPSAPLGVVSLNGKSEPEETPKQWAEGFEWFWAEYPRKVAKEAARKSYARIRPRTQATFDLLMAGVRLHQRSEWAERSPDKIPHASTWLNQRRWTDAEALSTTG